MARPRFEQMARERYGIVIHSGPFGIDSRPALIGAKYAEAQGVGDAYHDAVFRAYWTEARSIEDLNVLLEIAAALGLDPDAFAASLGDSALSRQVDADIDQAAAYGLGGVPALVFENKYLVSGAQPYDVLRGVVERIAAERGEV